VLGILQRHRVIRAINADDFGMSQQPCRKCCDLDRERTFRLTVRTLGDENGTPNASDQIVAGGLESVSGFRSASTLRNQLIIGFQLALFRSTNLPHAS